MVWFNFLSSYFKAHTPACATRKAHHNGKLNVSVRISWFPVGWYNFVFVTNSSECKLYEVNASDSRQKTWYFVARDDQRLFETFWSGRFRGNNSWSLFSPVHWILLFDSITFREKVFWTSAWFDRYYFPLMKSAKFINSSPLIKLYCRPMFWFHRPSHKFQSVHQLWPMVAHNNNYYYDTQYNTNSIQRTPGH